MDDSERSYGYSQDIYHGCKGVGGHYDRTRPDDEPGTSSPERSYEYGPEGGESTESEDVEVSPEEAAIHVDQQGLSRSESEAREERYDYGRDAEEVESSTWGSNEEKR